MKLGGHEALTNGGVVFHEIVGRLFVFGVIDDEAEGQVLARAGKNELAGGERVFQIREMFAHGGLGSLVWILDHGTVNELVLIAESRHHTAQII